MFSVCCVCCVSCGSFVCSSISLRSPVSSESIHVSQLTALDYQVPIYLTMPALLCSVYATQAGCRWYSSHYPPRSVRSGSPSPRGRGGQGVRSTRERWYNSEEWQR